MRALLLFHGGVGWLPGGFLGVDAFFVLSGFLITSLLLAERRATGPTAGCTRRTNSRASPGGFTWSVDGLRIRSDGLHFTPAGVQRWI